MQNAEPTGQVFNMKRLILFFLAIPFLTAAQPNNACNPETFTMKWTVLNDYQVWGTPRKDRKPVEEKIKLHLNQGLEWIKAQSAGVTGSRMAEYYHYYYHGNALDKSPTNSWYQASGRVPYYHTKITSNGLICRNNTPVTLTGPANIFLYINFANEIVRPMTTLDAQGNSVPLRINGKVIYEVPIVKRSEDRVDYYEYPGPPPPTVVNYGKWEFIDGYIIRNSDKQLLLPITRKEYLQQYLVEMEKYYKKQQALILQHTNVKSPEEIDKELKDRIEEIKKFTEQGAWGYSKDNLEQRIEKAKEFYSNKKEEELNKVKNLTQEADENYDESVNIIKTYLQGKPAEELNKPVPYRLGDLLVNTLYDVNFTQRTLDRLEATKEGTYFWGDTKQLCYINKDYFNTALPPEVPQFIAVEFVNLESNHKHLNDIVANINRDYNFKALQQILMGTKLSAPLAQSQQNEGKAGNRFLPKSDSLKKLGIVLAPVKDHQGNDVYAGIQSPGFTAQPIPINYPPVSELLSKIPTLGNETEYRNYLKSTAASISNALSAKSKTALDQHILTRKVSSSEQYSREAIGAWLSGYPAAALYFHTKASAGNVKDGLSANNFAVHLIQSGYPDKALPVLHYWLKQHPKNSLLLGNAASAYYYLGDMNLAMQYAAQCLAVDSLHPTANKTIALGYFKQGNKIQAKRYLSNCLKGGYDEEVVSLILTTYPDANISKLLYEGRRYGKEPLLFKRFLLPEAITGIAEAKQQGKTIQEVLESLELTMQAISAKRNPVDLQKLTVNNPVPKMQQIGQAIVMESWNTYRKAYGEHYQHLQQRLKEEEQLYAKTTGAIVKKYNDQISKLQTGEGEDLRVGQLEKDKCQELNKAMDNYLKSSSSLIHTFGVRLELISRRHYTTTANWTPHWLQSDEAADFPGTQINYLRDMRDIIKLYPLLEPADCGEEELEEEKSIKGKLMVWEDKFYPMKMSLGVGVAKASMSCNTFSISGGELIQGEIEIKMDPDWNQITELTIAGGVGATWNLGDTDIARIEAGASTKAYVKFERSATGNWNYQPTDIGFKSEASITGKAGTVEMEVKVAEVTVGLQSGVDIDGVVKLLPVMKKPE